MERVKKLRYATERIFWRHTASLAGLAVRHRRMARILPLVVLAGGAFILGRVAGHTFLPTP